MLTVTASRMLDSVPDYYQTSDLFASMQDAVAVELEQLTANNEDIKLQRRIATATWGLKYWEQLFKIPTIETDSYEVRRSRVLGKKRGVGKLASSLIERIAEAYSGDVQVTINAATYNVNIKFIGTRGIPSNLSDLQAQLDAIIHAHLGITYQFTYLTFDELETAHKTWAQLEALSMNWNTLETWRPS